MKRIVLILASVAMLAALPARADEVVSDDTAACVMAALKALPSTVIVSDAGVWINEAGQTKFISKVMFYSWWNKDRTGILGPLTLSLTKSGSEILLSEMLRVGAMPPKTLLGNFLGRDSKDNPLFAAFDGMETKCNVFYRGGRNTE